MNFNTGDILVDLKDGDHYTVIPYNHSQMNAHILCEIISSNEKAHIGMKLWVKKDGVRFEKPRLKCHPLTSIFK